MTMSLPSKPIYVVDLPDPIDLKVKFVYNYFVNDESTNDSGGIPSSMLMRTTIDSSESTFVQYATTRVPRYVDIKFTLKQSSNQQTNSSPAQYGTLIRDNFNKIISEDAFSFDGFAAMSFFDGGIKSKLETLVSGSAVQHLSALKLSTDGSISALAKRLVQVTPPSIDSQFLQSSLNDRTVAGTSYLNDQGLRIQDDYNGRNDVTTYMQVNTKFASELIDLVIKDPNTFQTDEFLKYSEHAAKITANAGKTHAFAESDYDINVPFISLSNASSASPVIQKIEMVGYVIDKTEIDYASNSFVVHQPLIVEEFNATSIADLRVKYGATYSYSVKSVGLVTLTLVDRNSGEITYAKVLVSSKPTNQFVVNCVEAVSPPPPNDLSFTWDYNRINPLTVERDHDTNEAYDFTGQRGSLMISWTFPTNSQRDIKYFQIFRRSSINEPYQLIKMFDFNDSTLKYALPETPRNDLLEVLDFPILYFFDDEFVKSSKFIYTVVSIDAHGYSSNYGEQFEISFDQFKNDLIINKISHSGAPKPYPNLYLLANAFVDLAKVAGKQNSSMKVYLTPECYDLIDVNGKISDALVTTETGKYVINVINVDSVKNVLIDVNVINRETPPAIYDLNVVGTKLRG